MTEIIKCKSSDVYATSVLVRNGFQIISRWGEDNRFTKDGKIYRLSHPVWLYKPNAKTPYAVQVEEITDATN